MKTYPNLCIRCGKQRKVVRTWKSRIGVSVIINTETACPDVDCQKKVDSDNKKQRDKSNAMKAQQELRASERMVARAEAKASKAVAA